MALPIIDISEIDDPNSQLSLAKEVTQACKEWGFLLVKEHPIPMQQIDAMFSLGHKFFSLPEQEKEPWPIDSSNIGYIGSLKDRRKDDKMSMWFGGVPGSLSGSDALPHFGTNTPMRSSPSNINATN